VFGLNQAWFYAVHSGSELDLFFLHGGKRIGIECKRIDAPRTTKSMHIATEDLRLDRLFVVYPGDRRYSLTDKIEAVPLARLEDVVD
jgi:predicted AAA+ superfamily ATPase